MLFEPPPRQKIDHDYFVRRAAEARALAALSTTARARDLHFILAADYDARAALAAPASETGDLEPTDAHPIV